MMTLTYGTTITNTNVFTSMDEVAPSKPDLEDFWNIESIGVYDDPETTNDEIVMRNFKETVKFENGRYQVTWPWKDKPPDLPVNRELAMGRLRSTVTRMRGKPELMKQYDAIIQDQYDKEIIERVNSTFADGTTHYLPHHAVINPLKPTTKLRIVYDASARSRKENKSLNECLYRGPVMLNDLCGLLMRFRLNNIAVVADIEKAFLQIGLQPDQRDVTRFIWLKDYTNASVDSANIQEYRFCRVPFGVISSPFLLGATIHNHLEQYEHELAAKLKDDIYVDNLITGTDSVEETVKLYHTAKTIFKEASMNLREWSTNSQQVNQIIDFKDRASCDNVKVLGYTWNVENDCIGLKGPTSALESASPTKRNVLREFASVFDPMGLVSPVVLKGKLFIQSLWDKDKHLDWDDTISNEQVATWSTIRSEFSKLSDYQISRSVAMNVSENVKYRLMCFSDASARAYAAAVYLFQRNGNSESRSDLLFSKSRLAPLKEMTIPRLELMAVLIGIRCVKFVEKQLKISIEYTDLWTDSQCVLKWLQSEKDLSVFVRNRVKEIKSHSDVKFHHISSKDNPADIATRGADIQSLYCNQLWWHGPKWLQRPDEEWPLSGIDDDERTNLEYEKEVKKLRPAKQTDALNATEIEPEMRTYSSGCVRRLELSAKNSHQ